MERIRLRVWNGQDCGCVVRKVESACAERYCFVVADQM